jgi:hypothetical protein
MWQSKFQIQFHCPGAVGATTFLQMHSNTNNFDCPREATHLQYSGTQHLCTVGATTFLQMHSNTNNFYCPRGATHL